MPRRNVQVILDDRLVFEYPIETDTINGPTTEQDFIELARQDALHDRLVDPKDIGRCRFIIKKYNEN